MHVAAATPNLRFDWDIHYLWTRIDVIEDEPFKFVDCRLEVSTEPRLAVRLDRKKLTCLSALYEKAATKERDDTAYIKQFDPAYVRRVPR